jgi:hypothetical protein
MHQFCSSRVAENAMSFTVETLLLKSQNCALMSELIVCERCSEPAVAFRKAISISIGLDQNTKPWARII